MSLELYLVFVLASALLIATPGPNVALVIGTSLRYGLRNGMLTVVGVNAGLILQLCAVAAGLSWLVDLFARHFDVIRYAGAAYLALLGSSSSWPRRNQPRRHRACAASTPWHAASWWPLPIPRP